MRVFVTGASGYIGQAVARAFRAKGHTVYGLVRTEEDAILQSLDEIWPIVGDLQNPDSYSKILAEVEVVAHCAFDATSNNGVEVDAKTIDTILGNFSKSQLPRTFIYTSGVWVYGSLKYKMADESMPVNPLNIVKWRPAHEQKVLKASSPNLYTVVIRPGHVYGGLGGLTSVLFTSTEKGNVSIVGNGNNRWPMIHLQDLAHAYVSAAEKELNHVILNVTDDSTFTLKEIAEAIARAAKIEGKITNLTDEQAKEQLGAAAEGFLIDLTVDNSRIKRLLGWQIHHAPFLYNIDLYYNLWKTAQQHVREF